MNILSYENHGAIPIFKCSWCGQCSGVETENSFGALRGCCFYFPKYTLTDIRIIADSDRTFLDSLAENPNVIINDYNLIVKGIYDRAAHETFIREASDSEKERFKGFDTSLLFKRCLFNTDTGCTIDFKLRPHPCNLYLCRGVIEKCGQSYRQYEHERKHYFAFCNYMSGILEDELRQRDLTLKNNFTQSIDVLRELDLDSYSFADLEPIVFEKTLILEDQFHALHV